MTGPVDKTISAVLICSCVCVCVHTCMSQQVLVWVCVDRTGAHVSCSRVPFGGAYALLQQQEQAASVKEMVAEGHIVSNTVSNTHNIAGQHFLHPWKILLLLLKEDTDPL